jgi:MFS family permease
MTFCLEKYMYNLKQFINITSVPHYEKGVWMMIVIRFINMLGYAIFGPYLMLYLNQDRGLSMTLAGLVLAFSSIGGSLIQIPGGAFTDRFGRRRTLLMFFSAGLLVNTATTVIISISSPIWLFGTIYVLSGFIWGMTQPAIMAVITDLTPKENLTEAYAMSQLVSNVGWIIGPITGGLMFSHLPFTYLYGTTIVIGVLNLVLTSAFLTDSFTGKKEATGTSNTFTFVADKSLLTYTLLALLVFIVYCQLGGVYSVFMVEQLGFNTTQYGVILTINGILAVVFQYPVTRWVATRLDDKKALLAGCILFCLSYLSLSWITGYGWLVAAVVVFTAAELFFVPSMSSIVGKLAKPEERGRYMGLLGTGTGLGIAIAPLLGGALYDVSQGTALFLWGPMALITFIAAMGYLRWFTAYKKRLK